MPEPQIYGFGEIILDHLFIQKHAGQPIYAGSRGGGSVWNVLANLASVGVSCVGLGVSGADSSGELAVDELRQLGVDTARIRMVPKHHTRIIFEELSPGSFELPPKSTFGVRCLVCGRQPQETRLAKAPVLEGKILVPRGELAWLVVDRLTGSRCDLAARSSSAGLSTALDLGRVGFLRYYSTAEIISLISPFNLVFMSDAVASFLRRRFDASNIEDLLDVGRVRILCVSRGDRGMFIYSRDRSRRISVTDFHAPPLHSIADASGAGDCFLAHFIHQLSRSISGSRSMRSGTSLGDIREAAETALKFVVPKLLEPGARGHLPNPHLSIGQSLSGFVGRQIEDIRKESAKLENCPFCGVNSIVREAGSPRLIRHGGAYAHRYLLPRIFAATEKRSAVAACSEILREGGAAYVVGTGGSFSAAAFIAQVVNTHGTRGFGQPMRPLDYCRTGGHADIVIVVSYSGSTLDCRMAIDSALERNVRKIVLVTANKKAPLADMLRPRIDLAICYGSATAERGFVSIAATVAPCAVWTAAVTHLSDRVRLFEALSLAPESAPEGFSEIVDALRTETPTIHAFGGGFAWPALLDLESKLVEGGLGTVQIHESKDFSHGRFMRVFIDPLRRSRERRLEPFILVRTGDRVEYEDEMLFELRKHAPVLVLESKFPGILGSLHALIQVQYLIRQIASHFDIDISKPKNIPKGGLRLYRWGKAQS